MWINAILCNPVWLVRNIVFQYILFNTYMKFSNPKTVFYFTLLFITKTFLLLRILGLPVPGIWPPLHHNNTSTLFYKKSHLAYASLEVLIFLVVCCISGSPPCFNLCISRVIGLWWLHGNFSIVLVQAGTPGVRSWHSSFTWRSMQNDVIAYFVFKK
jgi:hypothetical protein